jgi:hypothetical protein
MNDMQERRKSHRISINHPIYYTGKNSKGKVEEQGVAVALDISADGMMVESPEPIDATDISIHASINNRDTIKVEGLLVYSMPHADGKYRSGIRFKGDPDQVASFFNRMCRVQE